MTRGTQPDLHDQVAVVTGSSSGIGAAVARELAAAGASLVVHGRTNRAGADRTAAAIRDAGGVAEVLLADLADEAAADAFVDDVWSRAPIDVWINNAGADVLTGEAAAWSFERKLAELWRTDVAAVIRLSRNVGRRMRARGSGVIVNVGWDQAEFGMAGDSGELFAGAAASRAGWPPLPKAWPIRWPPRCA